MKLTLQQILHAGWKGFAETAHLPGYLRKAASVLMKCRTEQMGGYTEDCPEGHFHRIWYHSCRHRSCPKCSYMAIERWIYAKKEKALPCPHYHTIFTIPDRLNEVWQLNRKAFHDTFIKSARDALFELLKDPKHMGGLPWLIVQLQTWANDLHPHVHLHCIVTGGGLTDNGTWVTPKRDCLLPRKVLMIKFRGKMRAALIALTEKGELKLPHGMHPQRFINLLNKLGRTPWNVKILPPYPYADGVIAYIGRYIRGGPLNESRLRSFDGGQVAFSCRGTRHLPQRESLTLPVEEFLRRICLHIPLPGAQNVRSFGLYAAACKDKLNRACTLLDAHPVSKTTPLRWQDILMRFTGMHPGLCPLCRKPLILLPFPPLCHAPPNAQTA